MNRLKRGYAKFTKIINQVSDHHVGAYAAQTAYFFMLCMIPIILLLLTLVRYTPITEGRCDERCDPCIPVFCGIYDHNDC